MSNITIQEIADLTAAEFGVTLEEMRGRFHLGGRQPDHPPALLARYVVAWLARRHTQMTFTEIGEFVNVLRRETVRDYPPFVDARREASRKFREAVERIERHIDDIHEARVDAMAGAA